MGALEIVSPSRGLRQSDPQSPHLFIMGSEVLARLINREVNNRKIKGVKVSYSAPEISKLFYADDVILFSKTKIGEINALMNCINTYRACSGQSINLEKSGVFASKGVHQQFLHQVKHLWGLRKLSQGAKYLGVPLFLSSNRKKDFSYLKEKGESSIGHWKKRAYLSQEGQFLFPQ